MTQAWIRVDSVESRQGVHAVAGELSVSVEEARALLDDLPVRLPLVLDEEESGEVLDTLQDAGVRASAEPAENPPETPCQKHQQLVNDGTCRVCGAWICAVCKAQAGGERICPDCRAKEARSRRFRRWRIAALGLVLVGVGIWALSVRMDRASRTEWNRTLNVALVIITLEEIDETAVESLRERIPDLEALLHEQGRRYRPDLMEPFDFHVKGPVSADGRPPSLQLEPSWWDRAVHAWELDQYLDGIDERAGMDAGGYDARIYLVAEKPTEEGPKFVEGLAAHGGEVGVVEVDLAEDTVDLALIAAAHELFHLLGAVDQYGPGGRVLVPGGLADPDREPLLPQQKAEIMARSIPKTADEGELADELSEIVVGSVTAGGIGWQSP